MTVQLLKPNAALVKIETTHRPENKFSWASHALPQCTPALQRL